MSQRIRHLSRARRRKTDNSIKAIIYIRSESSREITIYIAYVDPRWIAERDNPYSKKVFVPKSRLGIKIQSAASPRAFYDPRGGWTISLWGERHCDDFGLLSIHFTSEYSKNRWITNFIETMTDWAKNAPEWRRKATAGQLSLRPEFKNYQHYSKEALTDAGYKRYEFK